jgi:hypothetical protein
MPLRKYTVGFANGTLCLEEQDHAVGEGLGFLLSCLAVRQTVQDALKPTFDMDVMSRRNIEIKGARKCN